MQKQPYLLEDIISERQNWIEKRQERIDKEIFVLQNLIRLHKSQKPGERSKSSKIEQLDMMFS